MALSRKVKIILSVLVFIVFVTVCVMGYGAWLLFSAVSSTGILTERPIPPELTEPRITTGSGFVSKQEIFKKTALSNSELIVKSTGNGDEERERMIDAETAKRFFGYSDVRPCGDHIIAAGQFGAFKLKSTGELEETIFFEPKISEVKILYWTTKHSRQTLDNLRIVDIDGDGNCEFVSQSSVDGVTFFNASGKVNWRYGDRDIQPFSTDLDDAAWITTVDFGDVDDDGRVDFLISKKQDGIRAFSATQQELWFQPDEFPTANFIFVDIDGDKKKELVELQGVGSRVRDKGTGKVIRELKLDSSTSGVLEFPVKGNSTIASSYVIDEGYLTVSDLKGNALFKVEAPLSDVKKVPSGEQSRDDSYIDNTEPIDEPKDEGPLGDVRKAPGAASSSSGSYIDDTESIYEPKAQLVTLIPGQPKFLVIVGSFTSLPRSNVYVYDYQGKLVYHELLGEDAETLAVIPNSDGSEGFLVGGKDTVWRYAAR